MKIKNITIIALLLAALLLMVGVVPAEAAKTYRYGSSRTTVIKDLPDTVKVGKRYTVKFRYTIFERSRKGRKKIKVKFKPWIEWGSYSYPSKASPDRTGYWHSNRKHMRSRWMKYGAKRTVTYHISFNACLPPWGQDWGGKPGDFFYWGLPCSSGRYNLEGVGKVKGGHWLDGSYPLMKEVFIVP